MKERSGSISTKTRSFSKICMLGSLTKLSIKGIPLVACSILYYIKSHGILRELGFDGCNFLKHLLGEELADGRKQVLNQVLKLLKIILDCHDDGDIIQMIVEELCERKNWFHKHQDK